MDKFSDGEVAKLNDLIQCMDRRVSIGKIDYDEEAVHLNYLYNEGTDLEYVDTDFYKVNTSCESVPCAIYEVVQAVFRKCVL